MRLSTGRKHRLLSELLSELFGREVDAEVIPDYSEFRSEGCFWINISRGCEHQTFWAWFRRTYDPEDEKAEALGGACSFVCPEFPTRKSLFEWLALCTEDKRFLILELFGEE